MRLFNKNGMKNNFKTVCRLIYGQVCYNDWVRSKINFLVGPQGLVCSGNCEETDTCLGKSQMTTASPNPSFRAPWRAGDMVVGRVNAGWTTSKSGHPCPCQNCSQGPPAEKTGRGSLLDRPSCPPDDSIGQWTELN